MFRRQRKRTSLPGTGLHVCPACRSDSVHAVGRAREGEVQWRLQLRCGECGTIREVVVPDDLAERFEGDVARGREIIERAAAECDRERMAAEVEVMALALDLDLIDAADFRA